MGRFSNAKKARLANFGHGRREPLPDADPGSSTQANSASEPATDTNTAFDPMEEADFPDCSGFYESDQFTQWTAEVNHDKTGKRFRTVYTGT